MSARFSIHDGAGFIGSERVSNDVDKDDRESLGEAFRTRRMRIDCGGGYLLSVVWGTGTYSDNLGIREGYAWVECSSTAEVAVIDPSGHLVDLFGWGDTAKGYCTPDEVIDYAVRLRHMS